MMKKIGVLLFTLLTAISCTACGQAREESLGELMKRAGLNTVLGMGTVFLVLILISVIIYFLGFIGKMQNKKPTAKEPAAESGPEPQTEASAAENLLAGAPAESSLTEEENLADDFELVAVIAAAIAASEGVPADSLVVRSIRRKASPNQWKKV